MMSIDTKLKRASILRSSIADERYTLSTAAVEDAASPHGTATEDGQESRGSPPMSSAHRSQISAPSVFSQNLHSKGFGGGVPLNTESGS
jgi:hypothetical protein